jgi:hypothetical protein
MKKKKINSLKVKKKFAITILIQFKLTLDIPRGFLGDLGFIK